MVDKIWIDLVDNLIPNYAKPTVVLGCMQPKIQRTKKIQKLLKAKKVTIKDELIYFFWLFGGFAGQKRY